jgi:hypothetical protein
MPNRLGRPSPRSAVRPSLPARGDSRAAPREVPQVVARNSQLEERLAIAFKIDWIRKTTEDVSYLLGGVPGPPEDRFSFGMRNEPSLCHRRDATQAISQPPAEEDCQPSLETVCPGGRLPTDW